MSWGNWVKELLSICVLTFSQYSSFKVTTNLELLSLNPYTNLLPCFNFLKRFSFFFNMLWNTLVLTFVKWKILCYIFSINASKQWELVALVSSFLSNQSFFLSLSCLLFLDFLNLIFLHLGSNVLMWIV